MLCLLCFTVSTASDNSWTLVDFALILLCPFESYLNLYCTAKKEKANRACAVAVQDQDCSTAMHLSVQGHTRYLRASGSALSMLPFRAGPASQDLARLYPLGT